ncbi:phosphoribosylglycinamide formyltransferase [bacterium]
MKKIAVLISGSGSNLQAIIDATKSCFIQNAKIECVISNKRDAFGLKRAEDNNIETLFLNSEGLSRQEYTQKLCAKLDERNIDLICLAGFMLVLTDDIFPKYKNKILNIHPALLPSFGGIGLYGKRVHQAVYESGVKVTGATAHFVTKECDRGPIILQEVINILDTDEPDDIAKKVLEIEHRIYPKAVKLFVEDKLQVNGNRVLIKNIS